MREARMMAALALMASLFAGGVAELSGQDACTDLQGEVEASFVEKSAMTDPGGRPADIEGTMTGDVQAAAYAWVDVLDPPDGLEREESEPVEVRMRHHYVGSDFTVWTSDEGVLTPARPPLYEFSNQLEVTSAGGSLEGGRGSFEANGTVDFGTGEIRLQYSGQICG